MRPDRPGAQRTVSAGAAAAGATRSTRYGWTRAPFASGRAGQRTRATLAGPTSSTGRAPGATTTAASAPSSEAAGTSRSRAPAPAPALAGSVSANGSAGAGVDGVDRAMDGTENGDGDPLLGTGEGAARRAARRDEGGGEGDAERRDVVGEADAWRERRVRVDSVGGQRLVRELVLSYGPVIRVRRGWKIRGDVPSTGSRYQTHSPSPTRSSSAANVLEPAWAGRAYGVTGARCAWTGRRTLRSSA
jgi:hypothetical protein